MKRQPTSPIRAAVVLWMALAILLPAPAAALDPGDLGLAPGRVAVALAPYVADVPASPSALRLGDPPPEIVVWYGLDQSFGNPGQPQRWVNILGNVSDEDGIRSLEYSINGGSPVNLTVGADGYRLVDPGDFNADPDFSDFQDGTNEVVITAKDKDDRSSSVTVNVEVDKKKTWPLPYSVDWNDVSDLQAAAQIVDGLWGIQNGLIHTARPGYDRLVAIGDTTWTDYEVTVPVTIHEFFAGKKGVGILVRWNGHGDDNDQPHYEHPFGGLGWYRYKDFGDDRGGWLELKGNGGDVIDEDKGVSLALNTPYIFKMQVETQLNGRSVYRLKVWKASDSEPGNWSLSGDGNIPDVDHGSLLLVANHADASFGAVTITPLSEECYSLTPVVDPGGSGTIDANPPPNCNSVQYTLGTEVELTAQPAAGHHFGYWSGDASGTTNPTSITMDGDRAVTAHFAAECFSLTTAVDPIGGGTMAVDPAPNCDGQYAAGTQVELTAEPASGFGFSHWSGDTTGDANPKTITMVGDTSVTAHFSDACFSLTTAVDPVGGGAVEVDPAPNCGGEYAAGTQVELTALPATGHGFSHWSGDASGDANPKTITMAGNASVTAHFSDECYSLTTAVDPAGGGAIDANPPPNCGANYVVGTKVVLTAQAAAGYDFGNWSGNVSGGTNPATITMSASRSVTAHFDYCHTLTSSVEPLGGGSVQADPAPDCGIDGYAVGTRVTLTAQPEAYYDFHHWSGDASGNLSPTTVTMDANRSVTAHFGQPCYSLDTEVDPLGSGRVRIRPRPDCGNGQYTAGLELTLTAEPEPTYTFASWTDDLTDIQSKVKIIMDADKLITAHFVKDCHTLTTTIEPAGRGAVITDPEPNCSEGRFVEGTEVQVTAQPEVGYGFSHWSGDASTVEATTSIEMHSDRSITAHFVEECYAVQTATEPVGAGTVVASLQPNCSGGRYGNGTSLTLTATPSDGYQFRSWGGTVSGTANPTSLTVGGDVQAIANFQQGPPDGIWSVYLPMVLDGPATTAQLVAPILRAIDNADGDGAYAVSWTAVPGAASYLLQEAADVSFGGTVTLDRGGAITYEAEDKPSGNYYYRVKARDVAGGESPWSSVRWVSVP